MPSGEGDAVHAVGVDAHEDGGVTILGGRPHDSPGVREAHEGEQRDGQRDRR
jgi:hypothetical protein